MQKIIVFFLFAFISTSFAQNIKWQKSFGGSEDDYIKSVEMTADSGFLLCGYSYSHDGDLLQKHSDTNYWLVKTDKAGEIEWKKILGSAAYDKAESAKPTKDGGYIVVGYVNGTGNDVQFLNGNYDIWVAKLDNLGNLVWSKNFGGSDKEEAYSVIETSDNAYLVCGLTQSNDKDVSHCAGKSDMWAVKFAEGGEIIWEKSFGGANYEVAYSVVENKDGNYLVAGYSDSNDSVVMGNHGNWDEWILLLSPSGEMLWQKCLGGTDRDVAYNVINCKQGGYLITGTAKSKDGNIANAKENGDFWLVKMAENGEIEWEKTFGGNKYDEARQARQTTDNGYIIIGSSTSADGDISENKGGFDVWVLKISENGVLQWQKSVGSTAWDYGYSLVEIKEKEYLISACVALDNGDIAQSKGSYDYWIAKIALQDSVENPHIDTNVSMIYPNPFVEEVKVVWNIAGAYDVIELYDAKGAKISENEVIQLSQTTFAVPNVASGAYFLLFKKENKIVEKKEIWRE